MTSQTTWECSSSWPREETDAADQEGAGSAYSSSQALPLLPLADILPRAFCNLGNRFSGKFKMWILVSIDNQITRWLEFLDESVSVWLGFSTQSSVRVYIVRTIGNAALCAPQDLFSDLMEQPAFCPTVCFHRGYVTPKKEKSFSFQKSFQRLLILELHLHYMYNHCEEKNDVVVGK
ncbi:hypothetical protein HPG69_018580 [Diceros bicornis minor]|uniref:Uncharacterized protein n=1 Tax=Diceros bicornis minor TaxID=77932 RepID=A0A7J7EZE7_DICBM|nr:hypothetical protein HPG69_018580 [Diceros bicornis minor]